MILLMQCAAVAVGDWKNFKSLDWLRRRRGESGMDRCAACKRVDVVFCSFS